MNRFASIPRFLLIHLLIFMVSVAGLCPALMGISDAGPGVAASQSAKPCCCGKTGDCCGMACCGTSAPKPSPSPVPVKPQQERIGLLHLALMQAITRLRGLTGSGQNGFAASPTCDLSGTATLQAKQIRLQV